MRKNLRSVVVALIAFVIVAYFYPGFAWGGNFVTLVLAGGVFAILAVFVKPVINILSLPFNLLTFGFFSFIINLIILYAVSFFLPTFKIVPFDFTGTTYSGFVIPAWHFTQLMSAFLASFLIGLIASVLFWIFA